jgi:hypothetical protein
MMRAALILASVSTLSAMELATPPRSVKAVNEPAIQSMVGIDVFSRDTLTKIDRLEIPYVLNEVPTRPVPFIERMPSANSTTIASPEASKILGRHREEPKKMAVALPKPRPKTKEAKKTNRLKTRTEIIKPCSPNAFDTLLRALNLSSGCQT